MGLEEMLCAVLAGRLVVGHPGHKLVDGGIAPATLVQIAHHVGIRTLREFFRNERVDMVAGPCRRFWIRAIRHCDAVFPFGGIRRRTRLELHHVVLAQERGGSPVDTPPSLLAFLPLPTPPPNPP